MLIGVHSTMQISHAPQLSLATITYNFYISMRVGCSIMELTIEHFIKFPRWSILYEVGGNTDL